MTEWLPFHFSLSYIGQGNGNPPQCSCLENPRDGGIWWASVYGAAQSRTWLKWLSSSSGSSFKFWSAIRKHVAISNYIFWKFLVSIFCFPYDSFYWSFHFKNLFIFNWRIIVLQYSVGFCKISTCISHKYRYVPSLLNLCPTLSHSSGLS